MQNWRNHPRTRYSSNTGRGARKRAERHAAQAEPRFHNFAAERSIDMEPLPTFDEPAPVMEALHAAKEQQEIEACRTQVELDLETADERKKRLKRESDARYRARKKAAAQEQVAA